MQAKSQGHGQASDRQRAEGSGKGYHFIEIKRQEVEVESGERQEILPWMRQDGIRRFVPERKHELCGKQESNPEHYDGGSRARSVPVARGNPEQHGLNRI
jgi:hypothetical protein